MKPIPSWPGFFASEDGEIFGKDRKLPTHVSPAEYLRVSFPRKLARLVGLHRTKLVHALVCEAFHGPRPSPHHQAAHGDGTRQNNRPENLRWATISENQKDRTRHGTQTKPGTTAGEINGFSKLSNEDVLAMRRLYSKARGKYGTCTSLARQFGISIATVHKIVKGVSWKHLQAPDADIAA